MPRTRSAEVAYRDEIIAKEAGEGIPRRELAAKYGVTQARISQIVLGHHEEISDDATRAQMVSSLFFVAENLLKIQRQPRSPKVTPSGRMIYQPLLSEDGEPLRDNKGHFIDDYSKPVLDDSPIIESAKQIPATYDRIAKLMGLDRKAPKVVDESAEYQAQLAWVQSVADASQQAQRENEELRARLAMLEKGGIQDAEVITHDETPAPEADVQHTLPPGLSTPDLLPPGGQ